MQGKFSLLPLMLVAVMAALVGCNLFGGGSPLETPRVEWVRADRATFDAIGEKFRNYVAADPVLEEDLVAKSIWMAALEDWRARLEAHERLLVPEEGGGD